MTINPLITYATITLSAVGITVGVLILGYALGRWSQDRPAFMTVTPTTPRPPKPAQTMEEELDPLYDAYYAAEHGDEGEPPKGMPTKPE